MPKPLIKVAGVPSVLLEIPVPVRKSYTARVGEAVLPEGAVQEELIVSVVPEMNPVQLATFAFVPVDAASLTFSVVKSFGAATHEPAPDKGALVGQADTLGLLLL